MNKDLVERDDWGPGGEVRHVDDDGAGLPDARQGRRTPAKREKLPDWHDGKAVTGGTSVPLDKLGLPPALVASWQQDPGGADFRRGVVEDALSVVAELPEDELEDVLETFDELSFAAQTAVLQQLSHGQPGTVRPIDAAGVKDLASTAAGRVLVKHLGASKFERSAATVKHRLDLIREGLSKDDTDEFNEWVEHLSDRQFIAGFLALAG
jgi:hypothetical protein